MKPPVKRLFIMLTLAPAVLSAQATVSVDPLEALLRDSPFLPSTGVAGATATGETGPLELRSVIFEDGKFAFSIYDQGSRESKWVKLGESGNPFVARSFDRERDTLTVEHQGRSITLTLQPARMSSQQSTGSPTAPAPLPTAAESAGAAAGQSSGAPGPTVTPPAALSAGEAQRLQNMADEIRRRRHQAPLQLPQLPKK